MIETDAQKLLDKDLMDKAMGGQGIFTSKTITTEPVVMKEGGTFKWDEGPIVSVLREHVDFIKEQLASKQTFLEQEVARQREAKEMAEVDVYKLRKENMVLKVALTQAICQVEVHNEQEDAPWSTDRTMIDRWEALTVMT